MYYMTIKRDSETGYWDPCKSQTLAGAKREATRKLGPGFTDAILVIASGDGIHQDRQVLATKSSGCWNDPS